ncbi:MAG: type II toxin-antitoxin system HicB family antitoxin [Anaerolineaceae bacterium]|nr:type II toxin-antitoxin system HicB family antitoxin [Chloroflexota bacterium]MCY4009266.1 type II toxin-antitoxin system HicB family antitoxin [Anaerolineaceae bacterium]
MDKKETEKRLAEAKRYAAQPYSVEYDIDDLPDGTTVITAYHPELPGCMSDGLSKEEAVENLADARLMYIEHLLKFNVPIPEPRTVLVLKNKSVVTYNFSRQTWLLSPVGQVVSVPEYVAQRQSELVKA